VTKKFELFSMCSIVKQRRLFLLLNRAACLPNGITLTVLLARLIYMHTALTRYRL